MPPIDASDCRRLMAQQRSLFARGQDLLDDILRLSAIVLDCDVAWPLLRRTVRTQSLRVTSRTIGHQCVGRI
jgi:hypothetical protein